jgi:hypothetical protein
MKKFLTTLAALTVIATPAFAQSFDPDNGTGNVLPFAYAPTDHSGTTAYARSSANGAYAQAAPKTSASKFRSNAAEMDGAQGPFYGVTGGTGWYSQDGW